MNTIKHIINMFEGVALKQIIIYTNKSLNINIWMNEKKIKDKHIVRYALSKKKQQRFDLQLKVNGFQTE